MSKLWFISYRVTKHSMLDTAVPSYYCNVITDVTPAKWLLESQYELGGDRVILYAEEIAKSMAVELSHGGAGIPTAYFL